MIIHQPEIISAGQEVRLQARVETRASNTGLPEFLWFSYPKAYAHVLSTRADSPLAALVLVAMTLGEDLECRGEASPRLLYNMAEYQKIFTIWQPHVFRAITIHADNLTAPPDLLPQAGFATTFSGGVDSFFTLHQMLTPSLKYPQWPLKYALFMLGYADIPLIYAEKYERLLEDYSRSAQLLGLELIPVRTNIMQFSANRIRINSFLESPLAGAALGLGPLLSGILMPAGRAYQKYKHTTTGPITAYRLSTETFESMAHGSAFTRLEKTIAIADWLPAQQNLRVCLGWNHASQTNCSYCSKCLRTRLNLHVLGRLEKFSTLKSPFTLKDALLWGRWMDTGFNWEKDVLGYAWQHKKNAVPLILLGMVIGYPRDWLRKHLPMRLKQFIFKFTAGVSPHRLFAQNLDNPEDRTP